MNDIATPAALREQAAALLLHGLLEHWGEVILRTAVDRMRTPGKPALARV